MLVAESVVKEPAAGVVPPITLESITAPSRLTATEVPVDEKIASIVSRSVFNLVPQVSVLAPTSGFVIERFVVVVSAIVESYSFIVQSSDHPDVDELHKRVSKIDEKISIATVYRTVKLFEESGIIEKHDFKGGKARYEQSPDIHHDHLIDVNTGEIVEFVDQEIEKLQNKVAEKLGYKLVDHRLELYGTKNKKD